MHMEIIKKIGTISRYSSKRYTKEVNIIDWDGYVDWDDNSHKCVPKLDIRLWEVDKRTKEKKAKRGIALSRREAEALLEILKNIDFNEIANI